MLSSFAGEPREVFPEPFSAAFFMGQSEKRI